MQYSILQYEKELLSSSVRTSELKILQRNSTTRLKEKVENKFILYHSTNEEDEQLRVIMFSFLVKIFKGYSLKNQENLDKLKTILYKSPLLPSITTHQGIEASQLFKCFAEKINSLVINEHPDQQICNIMNKSPFFENVLFIPVEQMMGRKQYDCKHTRLNIIRTFWKNEFGLTLKMPEYGSHLVEEKQDELILYKINNHLHKVCRIETKDRLSSSSSLSKDNEYAMYTVSPFKEEESIKMENSANINDISPIIYPKKEVNIQKFKSEDHSHPCLHTNEGEISNFVTTSCEKKKKRVDVSEKKQPKKGFFEMFCCCE